MVKKNSHVHVIKSGYVPSNKAKDKEDHDTRPQGLFPPVDFGPTPTTLGPERNGGGPYHIPALKPRWGDQHQYERESREIRQIMKRIRSRGKKWPS